jgi:glyoxylase-like metal-dependent hydrolase (beta-lactamase superfamily II)
VKRIQRRTFIGSAVGVFGLATFELNGITYTLTPPDKSDEYERIIRLKGKQDSNVIHWDIITIGNLSRNRYWGESDKQAMRSAICTCTVISGKDFHIIVDPSLEDETAMAAELKRRTGLTSENIDMVFITHQHGDHVAGIKHFVKARWLAGSDVASGLNKSAIYPKQIEAAGNNLFETIDVINTPGHTPDHHSLRFDYKGFSVLIAGDSVATKDFWDERRSYYNVMNIEESKRTMGKINEIADVIVPGHDNYFFNF